MVNGEMVELDELIKKADTLKAVETMHKKYHDILTEYRELCPKGQSKYHHGMAVVTSELGRILKLEEVKIERPKRKRFICDLCSFKSDDKEEMEAHLDEFHRRLKT